MHLLGVIICPSAQDFATYIICANACTDPEEGDKGSRQPPPPPLKKYKAIGFLSNTAPGSAVAQW